MAFGQPYNADAGKQSSSLTNERSPKQEMEAKRPRLQGPTAQAKPAPAAANVPSQAAAPGAKLAGADLPGPLQPISAASKLSLIHLYWHHAPLQTCWHNTVLAVVDHHAAAAVWL